MKSLTDFTLADLREKLAIPNKLSEYFYFTDRANNEILLAEEKECPLMDALQNKPAFLSSEGMSMMIDT